MMAHRQAQAGSRGVKDNPPGLGKERLPNAIGIECPAEKPRASHLPQDPIGPWPAGPHVTVNNERQLDVARPSPQALFAPGILHVAGGADGEGAGLRQQVA